MATKKAQFDSWRTVRFFLEEDGVFEVMFDTLGKFSALRCSCPAFAESGGCRHTAWVNKNLSDEIEDFLDSYPREITDKETWRRAVLTNHRVEVI